MPIALAGGVRATILSIVGLELLPFFSTLEACTLRLVCREFVGAIADVRWSDTQTRIRGSLGKWRACFPRARAANVQEREDLADADFVHLAGLHTLDISYCRPTAITDAAFAHLRGIHTLDMSCWYYYSTISDAAFANLRGIHTLDMSGCQQDTIADAAFAHLRGIHTLSMIWCSQSTITDAAFANLRGIHTLDMSHCHQDNITEAAMAHLVDIHKLHMECCTSEATFAAEDLDLNVIRKSIRDW
jgi:hypothetical protein